MIISFIEQEVSTINAEILVYDLSTDNIKTVNVIPSVGYLKAVKAKSAYYTTASAMTEAYILGYMETTSKRDIYLFKFEI